MDKRPNGACCGNCCAWENDIKERYVEIGKNQFGPIVTFPGHCHMLPNSIRTLASHFCFMWRMKAEQGKTL